MTNRSIERKKKHSKDFLKIVRKGTPAKSLSKNAKSKSKKDMKGKFSSIHSNTGTCKSPNENGAINSTKNKNRMLGIDHYKKNKSVEKLICKFGCCRRIFTKNTDFTVHMNTHVGLKPYTCKSCSRHFINRAILKSHKCGKSLGKKRTFQCQECKKTFLQPSTLMIHVRSHNKIYPYACRLCSKKFILKSTMYNHVLTHVTTFECQTCFKVFQTPSQLEQHTYTHMKDMAVFKCLHCPRILLNQNKYEKHINWHVRQSAFMETSWRSETSETSKRSSLENQPKKEEPNCISNDSIVEEEDYSQYFKESFYIEKSKESLEKGNDLVGSTVSFLIEPSKVKKDPAENVPSITKLDCVLCNTSFDTVPEFMQHVNSHEMGINDFKSDQTVTPIVSLVRASSTQTIFICRWCNKKFATHKFAVDHVIHFAQSPNDIHSQCMEDLTLDVSPEELVDKYIYSVSVGTCKTVTSDSSSMKSVIYYCAKCSTHFQDKQRLFGHVQNCTKVTLKYCCPICNMYFETNNLLKKHIKLGHKKILTEPTVDLVIITADSETPVSEPEKNEPLSCNRCDLIFTSTQEFMEHRETKHIGNNLEVIQAEEAEFICAHCNNVFPSQAALYKHLCSHGRKRMPKTTLLKPEYIDQMMHDSINERWICRICRKSYSTKSNLVRHITLHYKSEKKDYPCPFCSRVFQLQRYLNYHIMYMHKEKDKKQNICSVCDAQFCSTQSLKRHMALHTGESKFSSNWQCTYCGRKCKCREEFKQHMRVHTGEKPYACSHCSYRAALYFNLQKHIRRCHKTQKSPIKYGKGTNFESGELAERPVEMTEMSTSMKRD